MRALLLHFFPSSFNFFFLQINELTDTLQQYKKEASNVQRSLKLLQEAFDEIVRSRRAEMVSDRWYYIETYLRQGRSIWKISLIVDVHKTLSVIAFRCNSDASHNMYIHAKEFLSICVDIY